MAAKQMQRAGSVQAGGSAPTQPTLAQGASGVVTGSESAPFGRAPSGARMADLSKLQRCQHWKEKFDEAAEFCFARPMLFNGRRVVRGEILDKREVTRIKLKILWARRLLLRTDFVLRPIHEIRAEVAPELVAATS